MSYWVIFSLQDQRFAIDAEHVDSVIAAVAVTSCQEGNPCCTGVVNYHGTLLPVISMHNVLGFKDKQLVSTDQFIICHFPEGQLALWVDKVIEVIHVLESDIVTVENRLFKGCESHRLMKTAEREIPVIDGESLARLSSEAARRGEHASNA